MAKFLPQRPLRELWHVLEVLCPEVLKSVRIIPATKLEYICIHPTSANSQNIAMFIAVSFHFWNINSTFFRFRRYLSLDYLPRKLQQRKWRHQDRISALWTHAQYHMSTDELRSRGLQDRRHGRCGEQVHGETTVWDWRASCGNGEADVIVSGWLCWTPVDWVLVHARQVAVLFFPDFEIPSIAMYDHFRILTFCFIRLVFINF